MDKTPVFVLTGFLGAGKSTLLNRVLADPAFADTAIIINELGDVALDHDLVHIGKAQIARTTMGRAWCWTRTSRNGHASSMCRLACCLSSDSRGHLAQ
ncbi:GTP-binding protein [Aquamicrobium sp. LC103]|uniref:GTP-binding protein n=1 Tax=Aquamicrobium sp. LC103 TaxID=1120658 RepID=UPI0009E1DA2E|nr:GTP-binding protein [Aquamicrobium sp. LC103]TKT74349.1 hypothetical protein XW59_023155 [Aquamicrobium sp. LC103]